MCGEASYVHDFCINCNMTHLVTRRDVCILLFVKISKMLLYCFENKVLSVYTREILNSFVGLSSLFEKWASVLEKDYLHICTIFHTSKETVLGIAHLI